MESKSDRLYKLKRRFTHGRISLIGFTITTPMVTLNVISSDPDIPNDIRLISFVLILINIWFVKIILNEQSKIKDEITDIKKELNIT